MKSNQDKSGQWLKLAWITGAIVIFASSVIWLLTTEENRVISSEESTSFLPVSIIEAEPASRKIRLSTTGITQARWQTTITSAVEGRVIELTEGLEPGQRITHQQLLLRLESHGYQAELDSAASRLANAKLALAREKAEKQVVVKTANHLQSSFARRLPHIAAAEAEITAAASALENARQSLADTLIRAPFDAIILDCKVTPGQWVQAGVPLFEVASSESLDVYVQLPQRLWEQLDVLNTNTKAKVVTNTARHWQASVRYLSPTRDRETRQRSLVLQVENPYDNDNALLPDQQVSVEFEAKEQPHVFRLPASAMTHDGKIWTVDQQDQLQPENAELLDEDNDAVYIRFAEAPELSRRIVQYPLDSMISGQKIKPRLVTSDGATS